ncbi:hypothetical protein [Blautia ammoniilytica]|uniref:Uncharacterized protein n=1 Tax=Blautia ammoniilytica TaxID=2981782 RepID=A0ABT2TXH9_9FIRM|nr:hypothetical protein [Blautia ammoniilytica]MCU6766941.1 hypothetical protein [Blautia ammoniilytica]NSJ28647.1 hypothetical protein [Blautia glucerasea]RGD64097.1 hypothetical protein DXA98_12645 [Lachnospiraceae bacterium OF09-6]
MCQHEIDHLSGKII